MVARNIKILIQNCKTEKQSQDSLCRRPKMSWIQFKRATNATCTRTQRMQAILIFFFNLLFFFLFLSRCSFFFLFFLCTSLPFTFFLVLLQDTKLELKICLLLQRPLFLFLLAPKTLTYKIKVHLTSCCLRKSWTTRDIQMKSELQCMMTSTYPNRPQTRPRPNEHNDTTRD